MSERLDSTRVRKLVAGVVGHHASIKVAREHGINVHRVRDEVITMCAPYAMKLAHSMIRIPSMSRLDPQDIEGASLLGLVEGVDGYEYRRVGQGGRPIQIQTHLFNRIRLRVTQERRLGHWAIMRPPQALVDRYMAGSMTKEEVEHYLDTFVRPHAVPGEDMNDDDLGSSAAWH